MRNARPGAYWRNLLRAVRQMLLIAWSASPPYLVLALVGTMLLGLIPIANAWALKALVDVVGAASLGDGQVGLTALVRVLVIYGVVIAFAAVVPLANQYTNSQLARRLGVRVRERLYSRLNDLMGLRYFEDPRFYDDFRLAEQGAHSGPTNLFRSVASAIRQATTVVGFFGVVSGFSIMIALLVLMASAPQLWIELRFGRSRLALAERTSPIRRRTFLYGYLLTHPLAAKEVRALGVGSFLLNRFLQGTREVDAAEAELQLNEAKWQLGMDLLTATVTLAAIYTAISMAAEQLLSVGDVVIVVAAVASVTGSLTGFFGAFAGVEESTLFFAKVQGVMGRPETVHISPAPVPVTPLQKGIEIADVSFRYDGDSSWLLKGASFEIPSGKCVALVGANGAGKSTLVKLLLRMYDPERGAILWNDQDIRQFDIEELRARIGVVFQDFVRFDMSVRDNIGIGNVGYVSDLPRIESAARAAGIHKMIMSLPNGYETFLSRMVVPDERTRGTDISGGQWQKLALARMYFRDGDFLILDEPTASMDVQSEAKLFQDFMEIKQSKTTLIITHRLSTSRLADYIAVLDDGHIVEYGSHKDLLAVGGHYSQMYATHLQQYGASLVS